MNKMTYSNDGYERHENLDLTHFGRVIITETARDTAYCAITHTVQLQRSSVNPSVFLIERDLLRTGLFSEVISKDSPGDVWKVGTFLFRYTGPLRENLSMFTLIAEYTQAVPVEGVGDESTAGLTFDDIQSPPVNKE